MTKFGSRWRLAVRLGAAPVLVGALVLFPAGNRKHAACVRPDPVVQARWAHVDRGWIAGDAAISVRLGRSKSLWLFGDSLVRGVRSGGRPMFVRNAAVVNDDGRLVRVGEADSVELFPLSDENRRSRWLWPSDGTVAGRSVWVFLSEEHQRGTDLWDWSYERVWLARLTLRGLRVQALAPLGSPTPVMWGAWVVKRSPYFYVFGVEQRRPGFDVMRLARTTALDHLAAWRYWNGRTWTRDGAPLGKPSVLVGDQFSVVHVGNGYALLTVRARTPRGVIDVYRSRVLTGPWRLRREIPITVAAPGFAYGVSAHPEDVRGGGVLLSYSVWGNGGPVAPPRFGRLSLACLL